MSQNTKNALHEIALKLPIISMLFKDGANESPIKFDISKDREVFIDGPSAIKVYSI